LILLFYRSRVTNLSHSGLQRNERLSEGPRWNSVAVSLLSQLAQVYILQIQYASREIDQNQNNPLRNFGPPTFNPRLPSILDCSTMENIPPTREKGKHLSDVDIGKILRLAKAAWPQRKIAALTKCTQNAIQNILATYVFETFQGCNPRQEYPRKTSQ